MQDPDPGVGDYSGWSCRAVLWGGRVACPGPRTRRTFRLSPHSSAQPFVMRRGLHQLQPCNGSATVQAVASRSESPCT